MIPRSTSGEITKAGHANTELIKGRSQNDSSLGSRRPQATLSVKLETNMHAILTGHSGSPWPTCAREVTVTPVALNPRSVASSRGEDSSLLPVMVQGWRWLSSGIFGFRLGCVSALVAVAE
jgi:hypothetical protein